VELTTQIGESVTDGLAYLGALTTLGGRAAYFTFIAPFQGKPLACSAPYRSHCRPALGHSPFFP